MDLTNAPATDPTAILRSRDCLYGDDMLVAGLVWMDFFTWLDQNGPATEAEIAHILKRKPRPTDVMLTCFRGASFPNAGWRSLHAYRICTGTSGGWFTMVPRAILCVH